MLGCFSANLALVASSSRADRRGRLSMAFIVRAAAIDLLAVARGAANRLQPGQVRPTISYGSSWETSILGRRQQASLYSYHPMPASAKYSSREAL